MKSRIPIIAIALVSGLTAAYLSSWREAVPAPRPIVETQIVPAAEVLVAATDLRLGTKLSEGQLKWLPWPADGLGSGMIVRDKTPNGLTQTVGAIVRETFVTNEPINKDKLVQSDAGYLAAILPEGKRALAISIDQRGSNSAGALILPNDHVDVIRIFKDPHASKSQGTEVYSSETLLQNIRVLAIGPNIEEKNGGRVAVGETATLELDPDEVNAIALAQRSGTLTLALRSVADVNPTRSMQRPNITTIAIVRGSAREEYSVFQAGAH
jgi:pilus assembly protein CpaB